MDHFFEADQRIDPSKPGVKPWLSGRQARILVAPLDWGLGHAARCIPIIREFLRQNCDVFLCGEGAQEALLKEEFPNLPFLNLEGYRIKYGSSGLHLLGNLFFQAPGILKSIKQENAWLKEMAVRHQLDAVISDNRFGLWHETIPSVFITHQLRIKTKLGKLIGNLVQKRNYHYINKFMECWVPDSENNAGLAGELSHPKKLPGIAVKYTGPFSRFVLHDEPLRKNHLLIILSGPEPQRTILENKIIQELGTYSATATVVRGLPGTKNMIPSGNMIRFYNHLPAEELNREMALAEFVISRTGYSTVMDLVTLKKKSILIPTPGQPEQEYLGKYLDEKKMAVCIEQKAFSLSAALQKARRFIFQFPVEEERHPLTVTIKNFVETVIRR